MTYRIIKTEEWERLRPLCERLGKPLPPNPDATFGMTGAAIAEDDFGEIKGVWFLQLAMHMEPLIRESKEVSFERLFSTLTEPLEGHKGLTYYCFTDDDVPVGEVIIRDKIKMTPMPYKIWKGEVK